MKDHFPLARLCAGGLFALTSVTLLLLPSAARAQDAPPQDAAWEEGVQRTPDVVLNAAARPSSTGCQLLLLTSGLVGMERLASWRLARAQRAWHDLAGALPAGSKKVLGPYRWRGWEVLVCRVAADAAGDGSSRLRAMARPALSAEAEAACVRWLKAEVLDLDWPDVSPRPDESRYPAEDDHHQLSGTLKRRRGT